MPMGTVADYLIRAGVCVSCDLAWWIQRYPVTVNGTAADLHRIVYEGDVVRFEEHEIVV